jgi:polar amino acid transport system substrate-binding protein
MTTQEEATGSMRVLFAFVLAVVTAAMFARTGEAQECGGVHTTRPGQDFQNLAERYYGDERKWSILFTANRQAVGNDPTRLQPGTQLDIPCLTAVPRAPAKRLQQDDAELKLLTGGNYAPFTGRDLPGDGLITEIVNAAFESSPAPVTFSLTWADDWSQHLFPLLDEKQYDVGFPWLQPNCRENPGHKRCRNFHFSEPLFEMLVMLFVRKARPLRFDQDSDLHGTILCRPKGYYTHDLDRGDRRWLSDKHIDLVRADSPEDCFRRLQRGEVEGVTLNEFLGRTKLHEMGLSDAIVAVDRPVSIEGLHVIVSKTHPRGTTFMYRFNAGLQRLKKSDRYNEIVARHLSYHWEQISSASTATSN